MEAIDKLVQAIDNELRREEAYLQQLAAEHDEARVDLYAAAQGLREQKCTEKEYGEVIEAEVEAYERKYRQKRTVRRLREALGYAYEARKCMEE